MGKVTSAIRLLGSAFFQEYTTGKKDKTLKTYDQSAFTAEELEEEEDLYWTNADEPVSYTHLTLPTKLEV